MLGRQSPGNLCHTSSYQRVSMTFIVIKKQTDSGHVTHNCQDLGGVPIWSVSTNMASGKVASPKGFSGFAIKDPDCISSCAILRGTSFCAMVNSTPVTLYNGNTNGLFCGLVKAKGRNTSKDRMEVISTHCCQKSSNGRCQLLHHYNQIPRSPSHRTVMRMATRERMH